MKYIVFILIAATLGGAVVWKAQSALPGDALYIVKTKSEDMVLAASVKPEWRIALAERLATRRVKEMVTITAQKKPEEAKVVIEKLSGELARFLGIAKSGLDDLKKQSIAKTLIASFILETRVSVLQGAVVEMRDKIKSDDLNKTIGKITEQLQNIEISASGTFEDAERRADPGALEAGVTTLLKLAKAYQATVTLKQRSFDARGVASPDGAKPTIDNAVTKLRETNEFVRLGQYHAAFATIREAVRAFIVFDLRFDLSDIRNAFGEKTPVVAVPPSQEPVTASPSPKKVVVPGVDKNGTMTLPPPDAKGNIEVPVEGGGTLRFKTQPAR